LKKTLRIVFVFLVIAFNIGCDQISKDIVRKKVFPNEVISVFRDHFIITNVENSGAFLSLGNSLPELLKIVLLSLLPLLIIAICLAYILLKPAILRTRLFAFCCIIGGGVGNIYDRITYGSVTDFLHVDFGFFRTGIFNLADVSIMTGAIMIFCFSFMKTPETKVGSTT
jgi:signal peptidase II